MLEEIVAHKRTELEKTRASAPLEEVLSRFPQRPPAGFADALRGPQVNIIAEVKYRSPSRGSFGCEIPFQELAGIYVENGAAAVSVLTDSRYFEGKLEYLRGISREHPSTPLLRKDFIVDPYQVAESRAEGASAYLLIVASLTVGELKSLIAYGRDLDLAALVEVHDPSELDRAVEAGARLIGVNNRNLKTFDVDLGVSFDLARRLEGEEGFLLVAESGIDEPSQIAELRDAGFSAFLVGSSLMGAQDPGARLRYLRGAG